MAGAWLGTLALDAGWGLFVGSLSETGLHAHHAIQIGLGAAAPLRWAGEDGRAVEGPALAVDRDAPHRIARETHLAALLFVDPESDAGRRLRAGLGAGIAAPSARRPLDRARRRLAEVDDDAGWDELCALREALLDLLDPARAQPAPPPDSRIEQTLRRLAAAPGEPPRLAELARSAGLSASRLSHLFREQVGLPLRRYALWLRLGRALRALGESHSLTEAAAAAGFADSAHLSRSFRRTFGITPSEGTARLRILQPQARA